ncbi:GAF domain-containing protein [Cellulosimicrobium sp. XJ-DQ-B-000]|uniref:GAF domain-containing protein n=1 Tax=Cellulosimicrobium sp. XJ-DQ-B-000 TaxID=3072182 RepID=UPI002809340A|nr:GAF domain-containing protein [Cellulosimicrobium sp. XJ-DQ-B-000]MDQ8040531.1 GAF domain-containing protein [Cellulosimicrobium sp. XJ-DQ-B-000]
MRAAWSALMLAAGRWWWLGPSSVVAFGVAGLLVGPLGWWVAPLGVVAAAGTFLEVVAKGALVSQLGDSKALLYRGLNPLMRGLAQLVAKTTPRKRQHELPTVLMLALICALTLTREEGSRASFFYRTKVDDRDCLIPHPSLSTGRGDEPVSKFFRDDGEGKAVWEAAETGLPNFCKDIHADPPAGMDLSRPRSYRTFVTAPVMVDGRLSGLLTINARDPGDLTEEDKGVVQVLARISSVAVALCDGMWVDADTKTERGG